MKLPVNLALTGVDYAPLATTFAYLDGAVTFRVLDGPGFLVESIRNGYELSQDARGRRHLASPRRRGRTCVERDRPQDEEARTARYIESLAPEKLQRLEERALESPDPALADSLRRAQREEAGLLVELYRRLILHDYLRKARENSKKSQ